MAKYNSGRKGFYFILQVTVHTAQVSHSALGPPTLIRNRENATQMCTILQLRLLLPRCVKLTSKTLVFYKTISENVNIKWDYFQRVINYGKNKTPRLGLVMHIQNVSTWRTRRLS